MPEPGDIKKERGKGRTWYYVWQLCESCGKGRWVARGRNELHSRRCHACYMKERGVPFGPASPGWKGGRTRHYEYVLVKLDRSDPFYPMCDVQGYVPEHRLVMARKLGRVLLKSEQVHHIDGIKDHNSEDNLELISPANHTLYKQMCRRCPLRKEVRMLRSELNSLRTRLL